MTGESRCARRFAAVANAEIRQNQNEDPESPTKRPRVPPSKVFCDYSTDRVAREFRGALLMKAKTSSDMARSSQTTEIQAVIKAS